MISFAFVFFLVRADTALTGELYLVCDSLSLRSVDVVANGSGTMLLAGVGITFATAPVVEQVFATLGTAFAELVVLSGFAVLAVVSAALGRNARGTLPGAVGFEKLGAATNIPGVTEVTTFAAVFLTGHFACVCVILVLLHDAFAVLLVSTLLSSDESSSYCTSLSKSRRR